MTSIHDFDYDLPARAIAQHPPLRRSDARLLVDRGSASPDHRVVSDLPQLLRAGDVLVLNTTKVLPARLRVTRPSGGSTEVLLLGPTGPPAAALSATESEWEVLVRPSRKVPPGTDLVVPEGIDLELRIEADLGGGRRLARLRSPDLPAALEALGEMPLPPYIVEPLADPDRYQTVYAQRPASAAAPTAGLHLTPALLTELRDSGIAIAEVELHVGLDTFRPVLVDEIDEHEMHSERFHVPPETERLLADAERVVAVGTTTVRALESFARTGNTGSTDLFIRTPFEFRVTDLLLTNFHLPKSTLLVMIDAFVGSRWRELYTVALAAGYRFLSFGDAMLLDRRAR